MTNDSHLPFMLCTREPGGDIHLNVYLANHGHMGVTLPRDRALELAERIVELLKSDAAVAEAES